MRQRRTQGCISLSRFVLFWSFFFAGGNKQQEALDVAQAHMDSFLRQRDEGNLLLWVYELVQREVQNAVATLLSRGPTNNSTTTEMNSNNTTYIGSSNKKDSSKNKESDNAAKSAAVSPRSPERSRLSHLVQIVKELDPVYFFLYRCEKSKALVLCCLLLLSCFVVSFIVVVVVVVGFLLVSSFSFPIRTKGYFCKIASGRYRSLKE